MITYKKQDFEDTNFVIGLDLDGTSGNFHKAFRNTLIEHQGFLETMIPLRTPKIYSYVDAGVFSDMTSFKNALYAATGQGVYLNLIPYVGFRKAITTLVNEYGAGIRVITSRPDDALDDTIQWLEDVAQIPYHEVNICHDKVQVKADVYIDDMPAHIESLRSHNRTAIVFDQVYNRDIDGPRLSMWKDGPALINQLAMVNA